MKGSKHLVQGCCSGQAGYASAYHEHCLVRALPGCTACSFDASALH